MKPKEKASELFNKFYKIADSFTGADKCALIAVEEILKIQPLKSTREDAKMDRYSESDSAEFWQEVKEEIKKLK